MDNNHQEILESIQQLSIQQAVLHERVESYLKKSDKIDLIEEKLQIESKIVSRHDLIIKASLWVYGLVLTVLGYKYFGSSN